MKIVFVTDLSCTDNVSGTNSDGCDVEMIQQCILNILNYFHDSSCRCTASSDNDVTYCNQMIEVGFKAIDTSSKFGLSLQFLNKKKLFYRYTGRNIAILDQFETISKLENKVNKSISIPTRRKFDETNNMNKNNNNNSNEFLSSYYMLDAAISQAIKQFDWSESLLDNSDNNGSFCFTNANLNNSFDSASFTSYNGNNTNDDNKWDRCSIGTSLTHTSFHTTNTMNTITNNMNNNDLNQTICDENDRGSQSPLSTDHLSRKQYIFLFSNVNRAMINDKYKQKFKKILQFAETRSIGVHFVHIPLPLFSLFFCLCFSFVLFVFDCILFCFVCVF